MNIGKTLYVTDRKMWRAWLKGNYDKEKEIWLIYPKKASGKPRILYNDAVEEALCFGWIDSTAKRIDDESYAQRFSPRNPKSSYSEANKARLRKLVEEGKVIPSVKAAIKDILDEKFVIPDDILGALKENKLAWANFQKFSTKYQRIRIAYVDGARNRPDEFKKRLDNLVKMSGKNKQFGFGGIQKNY
jgi:uncharacterized protein YdeI (YjbR/CyaY-like superfamily)